MDNLKFRLTGEHLFQLIALFAGLAGLYMALNDRITVLEVSLADLAVIQDARYDSLQLQFETLHSRLDEMNLRLRDLDAHVDEVDDHIFQHVQDHNQ